MYLDHYQKIDAKELKIPNLSVHSGFGFALSKEKVDIDKNGFNDFAIGAPYGGPSLVLNSRPIISFIPKELKLISNLPYIKLDDNENGKIIFYYLLGLDFRFISFYVLQTLQ